MKKLFLSILIILFTLNVVYALDNINWYSYEDGVALSKETGKPLLIVGYGQNPPELVFKDVLVINSVNNNYVPIKSQSEKQVSITINITTPDQQSLVFRSYKYEDNWYVNQTELLELLNKYGQTPYKYDIYELNKVTIKEFKTFLANLEKQKLIKVNAKLEGATIRELSGPTRDLYSLTLDDGTSTLYVIYTGGLGNIKTGDQVDADVVVEGLLHENRGDISPRPKIIKIAKSGNLNSQNIPKTGDSTSTSRTPGFSLIIGIFALLFIWRRIKIK